MATSFEDNVGWSSRECFWRGFWSDDRDQWLSSTGKSHRLQHHLPQESVIEYIYSWLQIQVLSKTFSGRLFFPSQCFLHIVLWPWSPPQNNQMSPSNKKPTRTGIFSRPAKRSLGSGSGLLSCYPHHLLLAVSPMPDPHPQIHGDHHWLETISSHTISDVELQRKLNVELVSTPSH